jgi:hypothetical protein
MEGIPSARAEPKPFDQNIWRADPDLVAFVQAQFEKRLENYKSIAYDVRDHHETEIEALAGGYSYRQVLELVQNGADAILEHTATSDKPAAGRIVLLLSGNRLYAANTGAPLSHDGIIALLSARSSSKRQNQIGRFGIGFKSLLGLEGPIDVLSRSVCLRFDPVKCGNTIRERLALASDYPVPGLRLAWPIDPDAECRTDPLLLELSEWATTVVRIEIGQQRLVSRVSDELRKFPGEYQDKMPTQLHDMTFGDYVQIVGDGRCWFHFETLFGGNRARTRAKLEQLTIYATSSSISDEISRSRNTRTLSLTEIGC